MDRHLDPLELDALRAGEGSPDERAHAESCPDCRQAVEQLDLLARRLREISAGPVDVPPGIDRIVLAKAAVEIRRRPLPRRIWIAAAAAALLAVGIGTWLAPRRRPLDIVDAYRLALRIRAGEPVGRASDFNGDGAVDLRDVDAIARDCVSLKGGNR